MKRARRAPSVRKSSGRTRVSEQNIEIVAEPAAAHGFRSFFVRGPDGLLIELVEAAKNPELCPP
jgi:catechol 2,3-dioxygenase-like lactoylglutathione lyase family enzyme